MIMKDLTPFMVYDPVYGLCAVGSQGGIYVGGQGTNQTQIFIPRGTGNPTPVGSATFK